MVGVSLTLGCRVSLTVALTTKGGGAVGGVQCRLVRSNKRTGVQSTVHGGGGNSSLDP